MNRITSTAVLLAATLLAACDKNGVQEIAGPAPTAQIKFFNFAVNGPSVNFYANDAKITAISSTSCTPLTDANRAACTSIGSESTTGTAYSGVGAGGFYSGLTAGQYTFSGRISAATDKDLVIGSAAGQIADGKSYSFYLSGFYDAATKKSDAFVIEDDFPKEIDWSGASVRFVNAISNSQPMTLYAKNTVTGEEKAIGSTVAYKAASAFVPLPMAVYDLSTRTAGSSTSAIVRTGVSFIAGRVYTIGARGDITVTGTTATNRPFLDNTTNR